MTTPRRATSFWSAQFFETLSSGDLEALRPLLHRRRQLGGHGQSIPGAGITKGRDKIIDEFLAPVRGLFEPGDPKIVITAHLRQGRVGRGGDRGIGMLSERQRVPQPLRLDRRDQGRQDLRAARVHGLRLHPEAARADYDRDSYDVVTVGSGHNGLVAAAYMAAAGKKVLVLERNAWFGGGVVTRELTVPGFLHDQHSMAHIFIQANPLLKNDELGLEVEVRPRVRVPRAADDVGVRGRHDARPVPRPRAHGAPRSRNSPSTTPRRFAGSRTRPQATCR